VRRVAVCDYVNRDYGAESSNAFNPLQSSATAPGAVGSTPRMLIIS
jgi:hypothetical protein